MSRIFDQLTLPEMRGETGKTGHQLVSQQEASVEASHNPSTKRTKQDRQLGIDELVNHARLHITAIERAKAHTEEEELLAEKHAIRLSEISQIERLARERAEAEQAERNAVVHRIELERQLNAQLELQIEQKKFDHAQAFQRAAQEEQLRRVIAEREENERQLQSNENAAQQKLHEAAIEEARNLAAQEARQADRLAAQLQEEKRLESLARERAEAEEDERIALAGRIEAERQVAAQIELRIEQENNWRIQTNKRVAHEEQLRIAAAEREAQERQLRVEELATQAEFHQAEIEEAQKRSADEKRRAEELAAQFAEEAHLEALAYQRTQSEHEERVAISARIEAERQLTARIEARIEQERLELEQVALRESTGEKLKLAIAEREALERRLQNGEFVAQSMPPDAARRDPNKREIESVPDTGKKTVRYIQEPQLQSDELQSRTNRTPRYEQSVGLTDARKQATLNSSGVTAIFQKRPAAYFSLALLVAGGLYWMTVGSRTFDHKSAELRAQPAGEASTESVKAGTPATEIMTATVAVPQVKAEVVASPATVVAAAPQPKLTVPAPSSMKVQPPPASKVTVAEVEPSVKLQESGEIEVHNAVMKWGDAWSRRDSGAYLSYYSPDFVTSDGMSRSDWEAQRKSRLGKYRSIKVTLRNIKVSLHGANFASVTFAQAFKADNHVEIKTTKQLELKNVRGRWLILSEKAS